MSLVPIFKAVAYSKPKFSWADPIFAPTKKPIIINKKNKGKIIFLIFFNGMTAKSKVKSP